MKTFEHSADQLTPTLHSHSAIPKYVYRYLGSDIPHPRYSSKRGYHCIAAKHHSAYHNTDAHFPIRFPAISQNPFQRHGNFYSNSPSVHCYISGERAGM